MARHSPLAKRALTETKTWMWSHLLSRGSSCIFIRSEVEAVDHELFFPFENIMCLCGCVWFRTPDCSVWNLQVSLDWFIMVILNMGDPSQSSAEGMMHIMMYVRVEFVDVWCRSWRSVGQRLRLSVLRPRDKNQCQGLEIEIRCIFFLRSNTLRRWVDAKKHTKKRTWASGLPRNFSCCNNFLTSASLLTGICRVQQGHSGRPWQGQGDITCQQQWTVV